MPSETFMGFCPSVEPASAVLWQTRWMSTLFTAIVTHVWSGFVFLRYILSTDQLNKDITKVWTSFLKVHPNCWSGEMITFISGYAIWTNIMRDWHQRFASVSPLMWLSYCVTASLTEPTFNLNQGYLQVIMQLCQDKTCAQTKHTKGLHWHWRTDEVCPAK